MASNARMTYTIVSPHEMNLEEGKISCKSPIGAALMGRKEGEIEDVQAPSGTFKIRIVSMSDFLQPRLRKTRWTFLSWTGIRFPLFSD